MDAVLITYKRWFLIFATYSLISLEMKYIPPPVVLIKKIVGGDSGLKENVTK